jgi:UDP-glucose 4-epimerase
MRASFQGSRVLITGGVGFIGSTLAAALIELGAKVTLLDSLKPEYGGNLHNIQHIRKYVSLHIDDIRDSDVMRQLLPGQDYLFNLAGQTSHLDSMSDPYTDLEINAVAQLAVMEACRMMNPGVKVVFASTRQVYGKPEYLPVDETHPIRPVDVNGINKFAGEQYHLVYSKVYGLRACALRLTNTYGPRMRVKDARQTFLGIWIRLLLEGKPLAVYGDGAQLRDFNYVDDCVDALLMAAADDVTNGNVYNLGSHEVVSLHELAAALTSLREGAEYRKVPFPPDREAIDIGDYHGDFSLIERDLGWRPRVGIDEGLKKTVEYFDQYRSHYWE